MERGNHEVLESIKRIHKNADDEIFDMVKKELKGIRSQIDTNAWVADKKFDYVDTKLQKYIVMASMEKRKGSVSSASK